MCLLGSFIFLYVFSYRHTYIPTCLHAYIHRYIHTYKHTYIHSYMHICARVHTYIGTHAYIHTCAHMHICIHTYIYIYIYIHMVSPQLSHFLVLLKRKLKASWARCLHAYATSLYSLPSICVPGNFFLCFLRAWETPGNTTVGSRLKILPKSLSKDLPSSIRPPIGSNRADWIQSGGKSSNPFVHWKSS